MFKNIKKRTEGFTIVETLIVLAIAGLIILIVLLAVPALQRNSRNTNAKSDASAVAGAMTEYASNNNGSLPFLPAGAVTNSSGVVTFCDASPCTANAVKSTAKVQGSDVISVLASGVPVTGAGVGKLASGSIVVVPQTECGGNASSRSVAVYYALEDGSGTISGGSTNDCVQG